MTENEEIKTTLARIETKLDENLIPIIKKHDETLYGNGKIGIAAQIRLMWLVFLGILLAQYGLK